MKKNNYVYTTRKQPLFAFVKFILRFFLHKPKIINKNDSFPKEGIIIAPHMGKWGPLYMSIYLPKLAMVGAHPMLGNYKERFRYLRDVLYIQKMHKSKLWSTIKASFEAIFSLHFYKAMHIIPSYEDLRLMNTISYSQKTMENGLPIMIFPENSEHGYQLVMKEFHEGFITLTKFLNKRMKKDLPIYPLYENVKRKIIIIGKPFYLSEFKDKSNEEILEFASNKINELNPNLEEDKKLIF